MDEQKQFYDISDRAVVSSVCNIPVLVMVREPFQTEGISACILNESGAFIWDQLEKGEPRDAIIRLAVDRFEDDPDRIQSETELFLCWLEEQNIIYCRAQK